MQTEPTEKHCHNDVMQQPFIALVPFPGFSPVFGLLYVTQPKSWSRSSVTRLHVHRTSLQGFTLAVPFTYSLYYVDWENVHNRICSSSYLVLHFPCRETLNVQLSKEQNFWYYSLKMLWMLYCKPPCALKYIFM